MEDGEGGEDEPMQEGDPVQFFLVAHVIWTESCMDMVTSACDDTNGAKQHRKQNWARSERQLIKSDADVPVKVSKVLTSMWQTAPV